MCTKVFCVKLGTLLRLVYAHEFFIAKPFWFSQTYSYRIVCYSPITFRRAMMKRVDEQCPRIISLSLRTNFPKQRDNTYDCMTRGKHQWFTLNPFHIYFCHQKQLMVININVFRATSACASLLVISHTIKTSVKIFRMQ